jgi:hypothetical protein
LKKRPVGLSNLGNIAVVICIVHKKTINDYLIVLSKQNFPL